MNKKQSLVSLGVLAAVLGLGLTASAKEKKGSKAAGMDPAAMEMMKKNSTPNENHKALDVFAGNWNYNSTWWMKPGTKGEQSTGTQENTWILGGRFLKQIVKGTAMGQPFEGHAATGYDVIRGEYQTVWMDDMMTGMMKMTGTWDAATKTLKQEGTASCPMTGEKDMWGRSEWRSIDNDNATYTSYGKGPDGKEFKTMEIVYKRAK
jgi:hypothetical protein